MPDITWKGTLETADQRRVEQAIRRGIDRGIATSRLADKRRGHVAPAGRGGAPARYDPLTSTITVPSFRDGGAPVQVPVIRELDAATASQAEVPRGPYTPRDVAELIRAGYPQTRGTPGAGLYYGVYVALVGSNSPFLYYLRVDEKGQEVVDWIFLYRELEGQRGALRLEPGFYTAVFEPHGGGSLHDLTRRTRVPMGNPDNLDLRVAFVVGSEGNAPVAVDKPRHRFYPRMHLLRLNEETPIATGSESVYTAVIDMWQVDDHWRPTRISFLAFIGTFPDFRWEIRRLTKPQDPHDQGELIRVEDGKDDYLRHTWEAEGDYRITCQVRVDHPDTYPGPVRDQLRERVILLEKKMATLLALYELEEAKPGAKRIWYRSIDDRIKELTDQLKAEKAKATPNQALVDALQGAIDKINKELAPWVGQPRQPFPIHAVFTDQKTSRTQPVHLFLSFGLRAEEKTSWVCYLIDLTYEPFYRTYEGLGLTPHEAMRAAFETSRKTLKRNYPPGHIWARVSKDDLERQGLAVVPGFHEWEFMTETESWEKEAYEWINLAVQVVGVTALVVSFVFPPSLVITGALVVTGLVGAAVSIANIVERVESNDFGWDLETFSDIANIAAAMVGLGAAAAEVRTGALARTLASAEEASGQTMAKLAGAAEKAGAKVAGGIASEAETLTLTRLASLARLQRVMVLTGLGMDLANLLILGYGTYSELKMIDAYAEEERQDYIRQFGADEGLKRWQQERYTRILGILVRAGLQGAMLAVSMKGAHERITDARRQAAARKGALPPTEEFKSGEGVKLSEPPKVGEPEVKETLPPEPIAAPKPAPTVEQTKVQQARERLEKNKCTTILDDLQEFLDKGMLKEHDELATRLGDLDDKELSGLEAIARLEAEGGGTATATLDWNDALFRFGSAAERKELLSLVHDITSRIPSHEIEKLDEVLVAMLRRNVKHSAQMENPVQGSWGQLYAARTLAVEYGATSLSFEVPGPGRVMDIVANVPGRGRVSVEVKTNLGQVHASFDTGEILIDLRRHAKTNYQDLLYLYHPDVAGQLDGLGKRMLNLFDTPELQAGLKADGVDQAKARAALQTWLDGKNLRTYQK